MAISPIPSGGDSSGEGCSDCIASKRCSWIKLSCRNVCESCSCASLSPKLHCARLGRSRLLSPSSPSFPELLRASRSSPAPSLKARAPRETRSLTAASFAARPTRKTWSRRSCELVRIEAKLKEPRPVLSPKPPTCSHSAVVASAAKGQLCLGSLNPKRRSVERVGAARTARALLKAARGICKKTGLVASSCSAPAPKALPRILSHGWLKVAADKFFACVI